jgi:hypothetical protein
MNAGRPSPVLAALRFASPGPALARIVYQDRSSPTPSNRCWLHQLSGLATMAAVLAVAQIPAAAAPGAATASALGAHADLMLPNQVWAGEVFAPGHRLAVPKAAFYAAGSGLKWTPETLLMEPWSEVRKTEATADGATVISFLRRTRALAPTAGDWDLGPVTQEVTLITGTSRFGNYARQNLQGFTVSTAPGRLRVMPLPVPPAEAGTFTGAVGQFTLTSRVAPDAVTVGQTITWTVALSGTGNWPGLKELPARAIPAHFRVLKPLVNLQLKASSRFDGTLTEDLLLVPEQKGRAILGPIRWSYFDPQLGRYVTLSAAPVTLTISPASQAEAAAPAWQLQGAEPPRTAGGPGAPPLPPPSLRDPIPGRGFTDLPAAASLTWSRALQPAVLLLPLWLGLAWWRMRRRDARRPMREARRRALAVLKELARSPEPGRQLTLIGHWQRESATLWKFRQAVPVPGAFGDAAEWRQLWREADRARFSAQPVLPSDWIARARRATLARRVPLPAPWSVLRPLHLLPVLALGLGLVSAAAGAEDAAASYRAGKFPEAEAGWRRELSQQPRDWKARHNLALALAQEGRWGEAAGEAASAFIQRPSDPVVRWDLAVIWGRARFGTPEVAALIDPGPVARLARLASPGHWQHRLIFCGWLSIVGLSCVLAARFLAGPWGWLAASGAVTIAGIAGTASIGLALHEFGDLARPDVAMVWRESPLRSVPTEVGGTQEAAVLAPGTLVRLDESFLTWRHLTLANGQTGWLRSESMVPLWQ